MTNHSIDYQNISSESAEELNHHSLNFSNVSIKVESLSKIYKLYNTPMDRLKETMHPFRKKYHKDFFALKDISFEVKKGETFGIIGKNGSGKSTLLKIITGVLSPSSGNVTVNGRVSSLLELGAGFNPELNGIENIYFYGTINGFSKEEMDSRLDSILAFADIGEFVFQPVKSYSSGMYVRLAFAVAIQVDPEILIIDEALSVGDIFFQQKCARRMSDLKEKGVTIIFVSHDMGSVLNLCNQVVYLKNGVVFGVGESSKMIAEYYKEADSIATIVDKSILLPKEEISSNKISMNALEKYFKSSIQMEVPIENEYLKILSISVMNEKEKFSLNYKIGEQIICSIIFLSKKELNNLHCNFVLKNKYDQIVFAGGSYTKKLITIDCSDNNIGVFILNTRLNLEAGIYTIEFSIGQPLTNQLNKGATIIETNKMGPITIDWNYDTEVPPFFGMVGLDYDVEWNLL